MVAHPWVVATVIVCYCRADNPAGHIFGPAHGDWICPDQPVPNPAFDHDPVNAPQYYQSHPSGIECIQITEHMSFCLGNAVKYIWRADEKGNDLEDLRKARWYLDREIAKREARP